MIWVAVAVVIIWATVTFLAIRMYMRKPAEVAEEVTGEKVEHLPLMATPANRNGSHGGYRTCKCPGCVGYRGARAQLRQHGSFKTLPLRRCTIAAE